MSELYPEKLTARVSKETKDLVVLLSAGVKETPSTWVRKVIEEKIEEISKPKMSK